MHTIIKDRLDGEDFNLSIKGKVKGLIKNFTVTAYVYYGAKNSRYYYEDADKEIVLELSNSNDYQEYQASFHADKEISFIMIKT